MFWNIYIFVAGFAVITQVLFLIQAHKNYKFALEKSSRPRETFKPCVWLTVPCKGIDNEFEKNLESFYKLDYDNYILAFVVECKSDPAYELLCGFKEKFSSQSKAKEVHILIAGHAETSSQKIHNLLYSCNHSSDETEVLAFADSDACSNPKWLNHLTYPLRREKYGASTGYRWFVPQKNNLATLGLSAMNAKVAQLLGNTRYNHAWGGSMAIEKELFYSAGVDKVWKYSLTDDLTLSNAVRENKMMIAFAPACLVASYETTNWGNLFEFARRQFLITRVTAPKTWWFALISCIYSLAGLWGGIAVAICAGVHGRPWLGLYILTPVVFFACQTLRAVLRQTMIQRLMPDEAERLKVAYWADVLGNFAWSWLMLICIIISAIGNSITWRGITYRFISPTKTEIIKPD